MTTQTAELDTLVKAAIAEVNKGNIALKDVLLALSPAQKSAEIAVLPVPQEITEAQRAAVAKVGEVFGQVVPTERRELTPVEVSQLVEEKETLDELKKMADGRWENIKIAVHNHLDLEAEKNGISKDAIRSDKGHYVLGGKLRGEPDTPKQWSREVRQNSPSLSAESLKALVDDEDVDFTHEDYLAATSQVRVLDENKLMLLLKKNPKLVIALQQAIHPGSKSASLYLRKA
jgi:hypothetical protein